MARCIVLYASRHGATRQVAERIGSTIGGAGHAVQCLRIDDLPPDFALTGSDRVILAAPVYMGRYPRQVRRFVQAHVVELNGIDTALVSVCNAAATQGADEAARQAGQAEARSYPRALMQETGWHPDTVEIVAGEVAYTRYGWLTRWVMKRISAKAGRSVDTTRDWSYTDWAAVDRFARAQAAQLSSAPPAPVG